MGSIIFRRETVTTCLPLGVGRCVTEPDGSGAVVCSRPLSAYQCPGAACRAQGTAVLSSVPERPARAYTVGQCLNRLPHKPPGRHQVCPAVAGILGPPDVGGTMPSQPEGHVLTQGKESGCRLPLPLQTDAIGLASSPRGGSQHLGHLRQGTGGSLRHRGVSPLPPLVLFDGGEQSSGSGCSLPRLAGQSPLCLSTNAPDFPNATEGSPARSQTIAGSPLLAREDVVPSAAQALPQCAMAPPRQEGPAVTVTGPDLASRPPSPAAVGLAAAGPNPLLAEYSSAVCNTIPNARAPSTRARYENRWKLFSQGCSNRSWTK